MVVLLQISPNTTHDLWSSIRVTNGFLDTFLTKVIFFRLLRLVGQSASSSVLFVLNFFQLIIIDTTVHLGTFNTAKCIFCSLPNIYASTWCSVGTLCDHVAWSSYLGRSAFPNHVQSIKFATYNLQSKCRNISKIIRRNRTHILSVVAKQIYEYLCQCEISGFFFPF